MCCCSACAAALPVRSVLGSTCATAARGDAAGNEPPGTNDSVTGRPAPLITRIASACPRPCTTTPATDISTSPARNCGCLSAWVPALMPVTSELPVRSFGIIFRPSDPGSVNVTDNDPGTCACSSSCSSSIIEAAAAAIAAAVAACADCPDGVESA